MNGCLRPHSYVNVYPISDSSEAVGHLILSVYGPDLSPRNAGSKVQPLPQGSHHILATSWFSKLHGETWTCQGRYRKKRGDETQLSEPGPPRQGQQSCLLALWLGRPGLWELILKASAVVQRTAACILLEEQLIVLETDEARAQLDCKAALWGERAPCLPLLLIDGKIITAAY